MAGYVGKSTKRLKALTGAPLTILLILINGPAVANDRAVVCSLGDIDREIEIVAPGQEGLSRLCEVYYAKGDQGAAKRVIWHAHETQLFCVERAGELLTILRNAGWSCTDQQGSDNNNTMASESDASTDSLEFAAQSDAASSATIADSLGVPDARQSVMSASRLISEAGKTGNNRAGHGDISLTYQMLHTDGYEDQAFGFFDVGVTDQHAVIFDINYWITHNLRVNVGIPYIVKRYVGDFPHDPTMIVPAVDSPFIDDGRYRGYFQDVYFGLAYRVTDGPIKIEPFFNVSTPVSDYPFFAGAAVGQQLNKLEIGSSFTYVPPLDDYYVGLSAGYNFVERTLGYNVDHLRLNLDVGYFLTPRFSIRGFVQAKKGNGLPAIDFPEDQSSILFYRHDQVLKHNYINVGGGFNWAVDDSLIIQVTALRTVRAVDIFPIKYGVVVSFIRSF